MCQSSLFLTLRTLACQAALSIGFSKQEYWSGLLCAGRAQISQEACSGSLTARFVNNNYVTAEITYSAAHGRHEILAWSQAALCLMPVRASPQEPSLLWHWGYIGVASWLCYMRLCRGCITAALWLCCGCCQDCCVSQESGCVMAAMPAQRE